MNLTLDHVTHRYTKRSPAIIKDITLQLSSASVFALVGESGCGKTTLGKIAVGLAVPERGSLQINGHPIVTRDDWRQAHRKVQFVHQDPYASLNPVSTIRDIIGAGLLRHHMATRKTVRDQVREILKQVGLPSDDEFMARYPNQLSGGQRQRVSIGRAIALQPDIIVADEAVSMLDVSMRVSVLDLLLQLREEFGVGYLFITHDFGVVRYFAEGQNIGVLYFGEMVEQGLCEDVIAHPLHPYTWLLLTSAPVPDPKRNLARPALPDTVFQPQPKEGVPGCAFQLRCPFVDASCRVASPPLREVSAGHFVACFFPERVPAIR
jgi:oligopeptide/dipeptide ABC transporter ATP-binding protein